MPARRVLVAGTTGDYIHALATRYPERCLFLTDYGKRALATDPAPGAADEVLADLSDSAAAARSLAAHLDEWKISLEGVVCFDCESMLLASDIASAYGLPYPGTRAVLASRSKAASKRLWRAAGVPSPVAALVRNAEDAAAFLAATGRPALLKPLTGSGSELIFWCEDSGAARRAFERIHARLTAHSDHRMYAPYEEDGVALDPRRVFVIETQVVGQEYSADFILDGDAASLLRLSRKVVRSEPVGTAVAYEVYAHLPDGLDPESLLGVLVSGARALGIERAILMVDFIIQDNVPMLIEMTPRPGGDCLPPLVLRSCGFDVLGAALEFAAGGRVEPAPSAQWTRMIGLRLLAPAAGVIERIDTRRLAGDRRVQEVVLRRAAGHRVVWPPDDYDSRILGHVIFKPALSREAFAEECEEVAALCEIGYAT